MSIVISLSDENDYDDNEDGCNEDDKEAEKSSKKHTLMYVCTVNHDTTMFTLNFLQYVSIYIFSMSLCAAAATITYVNVDFYSILNVHPV